MAKTLRVRTKTGWVTKPVADDPANRLSAEEVDDNFLDLEGQIEDKADDIHNHDTAYEALGDIATHDDNAAAHPTLSARAPAAHTHLEADITDLPAYEPAFTKNTAFNKDFGSAVDTICPGNDARLSNDRDPNVHGHSAHDQNYVEASEIHTQDTDDYLDFGGANEVSAEGLKVLSNPNLLIDGNFEFWDEGTSFTDALGNVYTATMWYKSTNANIERTTTVPDDKSTYSLRISGTGTYISARCFIPSVITKQIKGGNCTISFWVYREVGTDTGNSQIMIATANAKDNFSSVSYDSSTNAQYQSTEGQWIYNEIIFPMTRTGIENGIAIFLYATTAISATIDQYFSQVKLELGTVATPFYQGPEERLSVFRYLEPFQVRSENGSRHVPLIEKRTTPAVVPSAGSAGNITTQGFELTHSSAASITGVADSRFYP